MMTVEKLNDGRPPLSKQQHTKTIIIDDEVIYLGSANQNAATCNSDAVQQAVANFNAVYNDANASIPVNARIKEKKNLIEQFTSAIKNKGLMFYLGLRCARVGLIDPEKIMPCDP